MAMAAIFKIRAALHQPLETTLAEIRPEPRQIVAAELVDRDDDGEFGRLRRRGWADGREGHDNEQTEWRAHGSWHPQDEPGTPGLRSIARGPRRQVRPPP